MCRLGTWWIVVCSCTGDWGRVVCSKPVRNGMSLPWPWPEPELHGQSFEGRDEIILKKIIFKIITSEKETGILFSFINGPRASIPI